MSNRCETFMVFWHMAKQFQKEGSAGWSLAMFWWWPFLARTHTVHTHSAWIAWRRPGRDGLAHPLWVLPSSSMAEKKVIVPASSERTNAGSAPAPVVCQHLRAEEWIYAPKPLMGSCTESQELDQPSNHTESKHWNWNCFSLKKLSSTSFSSLKKSPLNTFSLSPYTCHCWKRSSTVMGDGRVILQV